MAARFVGSLGVLVVCSGLASTAYAGEPESVDPGEGLDPHVYMGSLVNPCGWPTAVAVTSGGGLCTGTLVHPRVVIYAAHCGGGNKTIRFGESAFGGGNSVGGSCQTYSGWTGSQGNDWAYCVLDQEVNLPLTPVLYGCELDGLVAQSEVAVVGFGKNTANGGSGTKRWAMTTLQGVDFNGNTTGLGGGGEPSVCPGDSGGPALIQGEDGIWRVFGIASTVQLMNGQDCGGLGTHSIAAGATGSAPPSAAAGVRPVAPSVSSAGSGARSPTNTWPPRRVSGVLATTPSTR